MVPFSRAAVPEIDRDHGWLTVVPLPGLLHPDAAGDGADGLGAEELGEAGP
jgi:hypothetical protein